MKFKLIVLILVVAAVFWYCTKPKTIKPQQTTKKTTNGSTTPTNNTTGGTGGGSTGGTGGGTGGGSTGGTDTNFFRFYPKTNQNPYPTTDPTQVGQIDGYVAFQFASWSIVSLVESLSNAQLQSWIDFKMFDSDNNLVCHIKNTQANYHPNFAQFFPNGTELRHNNHEYQYRKYLPYGTYRIEHSNISPQPIEQNLRLGTQGEGGNVYSKINQKVGLGTHTFDVVINQVSQYEQYEYDCNPYSF